MLPRRDLTEISPSSHVCVTPGAPPDVPDLIDEGKAPPIFKKGPGGYELHTGSRRVAEVHGVLAKNARGELPAIVLTPDEDPTYGEIEPQSLAMTRSIGCAPSTT